MKGLSKGKYDETFAGEDDDDPDIQTSSSAGYVSMAVYLRPLRTCYKN